MSPIYPYICIPISIFVFVFVLVLVLVLVLVATCTCTCQESRVAADLIVNKAQPHGRRSVTFHGSRRALFSAA